MDEQTLDRIDRYLRGEMSDKESLLFEQEALNDEHLRKETELTYSIKRRLADRKQKLYQTDKWRKSKQNKFLQMGGLFAVAASLVVGLFIIMPKQTPSTDSMVLAKNDGEIIDSLTPSVENQRIAKVERTMREGRHQEALKEIEEIEEEQELPSINTIIVTEREMDVQLTSYTPDEKVVEAYELNWLRIQSMTKVGMEKEAQELLKTFVQINGNHQTAADSLLREIEIK